MIDLDIYIQILGQEVGPLLTEELLHAYSIMRNITDMILYYFDRHSI